MTRTFSEVGPDWRYYAIGNNEIWFEHEQTGEIKVIGVESESLPSDTTQIFGLSLDYPYLYIYKVLSKILTGRNAEYFEEKYKMEADKVRKDLKKQSSAGRVYLEEI